MYYEIILKLKIKMENHHKMISNNLLIKTISKIQSPFSNFFLKQKLIRIKFEGFVKINNIIYYEIKIIDEFLNKIWEFKARYSELYDLHLELQDFENNITNLNFFFYCSINKNKKLPEFPPKKYFYSNDNNELFNERIELFQNYFDILFNSGNFSEIFEYGFIGNFFYNIIWKNLKNKKQSNLESWDQICMKVIIFY